MKVLKNPFGCSFCQMTFTLTDSLKKHVERIHFQKQTRSILKNSILKNKIKYSTENKPSSKSNQNEMTDNLKPLSEVQKETLDLDDTVIDQKSFSCKFSEKILQRKENLKNEESFHTGKQSFFCMYCEKKFIRNEHLLNHYRSHTGEKPFLCKFCRKRYSRKEGLDNHERTHTGEKPFSCSYCQKRFHRQNVLKSHERIHSGEKPFSCNFCVKKFFRKAGLDNHERIHTGEKPYSCAYCQKKFRQQNTMKSHERIHIGEKPYPCNYCSKKFPRKEQWKNHENRHLGIKPFSCRHCNKMFRKKTDLKTHEIIHTEVYSTDQVKNENGNLIKVEIKPVNGRIDMNVKVQNTPLPRKYKKNENNTYISVPDDSLSKNEEIEIQNSSKLVKCETNFSKNMGLSRNLFACAVCKETFPTTTSLITHVQTHVLNDSKIVKNQTKFNKSKNENTPSLLKSETEKKLALDNVSIGKSNFRENFTTRWHILISQLNFVF